MVPDPIRPKNPQMLMSATKMETSEWPSAIPIWPMLFMTAIPVPTPHRNDTNSIQKSKLRNACMIVWSSPKTGRFRISPSSFFISSFSSSFCEAFSLSPSSAAGVGFVTGVSCIGIGSGICCGCCCRGGISKSVTLRSLEDFHRAYIGRAKGRAMRRRSTAAKAWEKTRPWWPETL